MQFFYLYFSFSRYETRTFQTTDGQPIANLNQEFSRMNIVSQPNGGVNGQQQQQQLQQNASTVHSSSSSQSSHQKITQTMQVKESRHVTSENRTYKLQ